MKTVTPIGGPNFQSGSHPPAFWPAIAVLGWGLATLLATLTGCQPPANPADSSLPPVKTDAESGLDRSNVTEGRTLILKDGSTLRYSVHFPAKFDPERAYPLVFALHYGGNVTPFYGGGMIDVLVAPGLQKLDALIVAPDSLDGPWGSEANRRAIPELLEHLAGQYTLDPDRSVLTGFSMGGHGTWVIAAAFPDRFACAVPIAGRGLEPAAAVAFKDQMPFYVIHSQADRVVPIDPTREWVDQVGAAGGDVTWVEVPDLDHLRTYEFAAPLADAVPWIEAVWEQKAGNQD